MKMIDKKQYDKKMKENQPFIDIQMRCDPKQAQEWLRNIFALSEARLIIEALSHHFGHFETSPYAKAAAIKMAMLFDDETYKEFTRELLS